MKIVSQLNSVQSHQDLIRVLDAYEISTLGIEEWDNERAVLGARALAISIDAEDPNPTLIIKILNREPVDSGLKDECIDRYTAYPNPLGLGGTLSGEIWHRITNYAKAREAYRLRDARL